MSNTNDVLSVILNVTKSILKNIFYINTVHKKPKGGSLVNRKKQLEWWIYNYLEELSKDGYTVYALGLPVIISTAANGDEYILSRVFLVHYYFYKKIHQIALENLNTYIKENNIKYTTCYKCVGTRPVKYEPMILFPAKNYTKLFTIIDDHLTISNLTKSFSPLGILIDGEPGLGKTKFSDFLANKNIIDQIYKIDMTCHLKTSFDEIMEKYYQSITISGPTVFVIDEIDKYIDYYIQSSFNTQLKRKESTKENKEDKDKSDFDAISVPLNFNEFEKQKRIDFLYTLLRVLERDGLDAPCVILFCSNNFNTIFGELDMKHFASLKKRFMHYTFNRCHTDELKDYLRHYNSTFENTKFHLTSTQLDDEFSKINNISIPYRDLYHISTLNGFNIPKMIASINNEYTKNSPILNPKDPGVSILAPKDLESKTLNLSSKNSNIMKENDSLYETISNSKFGDDDMPDLINENPTQFINDSNVEENIKIIKPLINEYKYQKNRNLICNIINTICLNTKLCIKSDKHIKEVIEELFNELNIIYNDFYISGLGTSYCINKFISIYTSIRDKEES